MIQLRGFPPELRAAVEALVKAWQQAGGRVQITSVVRPLDQQARLRRNWESCVVAGLYPSNASLGGGLSCAYPANRPGDSAHNYGLAWDSWVPPEQMDDWVAWRRWQGWTVPDNDKIHAEIPDWRQYVKAA